MKTEFTMQELVGSLDRAVTETMETMFFTEVRSADSAAFRDEVIQSVMRFSGDESGFVELRLAYEAARELAGSFLGLATDALLPVHVESVCGELANMICGAMVSIAKPNGHFNLQYPLVSHVAAGPMFRSLTRSYSTDKAFVHVGVDCMSLAMEIRV